MGHCKRPAKWIILACLVGGSPATAGDFPSIDEVPVSGNVVGLPEADLREALSALEAHSHGRPSALAVINKDEVHGYLPDVALGYLTIKRNKILVVNGSEHLAWDASGQGFPHFSPALSCIREAQTVSVFPNRTPGHPRRDEPGSRPLGEPARTKLVHLLSKKQNWLQGLYSLGIMPDDAARMGFIFRCGGGELILFVRDGCVGDGAFNGEHVEGLIWGRAATTLGKWMQRYAQPELAARN